jgi:hypothetical protein
MPAFQSRLTRLPLHDITAVLDHLDATLLNISRTGALMRLPEDRRLGGLSCITLTKDHVQVTLLGRIVRSDADPKVTGQWLVAMEFRLLSPAEVGTRLAPLLAVAR